MTDLSPEEIDRYSRHIMIPEVGMEGQKKLKAASVLIIGVGGLGSPLAQYLAAAGIGRIGLVDNDVIEASNLQRQVLYNSHQVGRSKVKMGKERLLDLNPFIQVEAIQEQFTDKTAAGIAAGYDILADCSDNFATRYVINELCVRTRRPDVYGAVSGFEGQVSVLDARFGPCYRCLFPESPLPEPSLDRTRAALLGVLPGVIGSLQANEVIKLSLGIGVPLYGSMLIYNAFDSSFQTIELHKQKGCQVCGE